MTSTRSAIEIPELEEVETRKKPSKTRDVALAAVLAALYAADVVFFAPISFQAIQVRIADVLLPLSILFGPAAVAGLTLGVLVGNFYASPFGGVDIIGGTIANFVATALALYIGRRRFTGAWVAAIAAEVIAVSLIVGSYLAGLTDTPLWLMFLEIAAGEIVAVGIGGYALLKAVDRVINRRTIPATQKPS
ncbi:MAG: QueT transporter family protein [Thaumarchaeota archaeon]|nr:QueT transporter family protein [Nitrososphaerota archaeon]